ncbi:chaperone modulator CbpM [Vibrio sp. HN007]|uniref:chaperone modulator CbpM n=1 Tax=Vibrio iocasae TaxID=3098914 RepID=UPI0035D4A34D
MSVQVLDEQVDLNLVELCRASQSTAEQIIELIEYGVIEPQGKSARTWRFSAVSVKRVCSARRLQQDLGINTPGVALVLDLVEELEEIRTRLDRFES